MSPRTLGHRWLDSAERGVLCVLSGTGLLAFTTAGSSAQILSVSIRVAQPVSAWYAHMYCRQQDNRHQAGVNRGSWPLEG